MEPANSTRVLTECQTVEIDTNLVPYKPPTLQSDLITCRQHNASKWQ